MSLPRLAWLALAWAEVALAAEAAPDAGVAARDEVRVTGDCGPTGERGRRRRDCVEDFFIDRGEVTRAAFAGCVADRACVAVEAADCLRAADAGVAVDGALPMTCVSFADAFDFCAHAGKRLPTEPEWVRAARQGTRRRYPWGDEAPSCERVAGLIRWTQHGSDACPGEAPHPADGGRMDLPLRLSPVCTHPAGDTPGGVCDLAGNAVEWVDARSTSRRYPLERRAKGGSPLGAEADFLDVDRGVWLLSPRSPTVGFRCARPAPRR